MKTRIKRLSIFAAGAVVAALAWFAPPGAEDIVAPAKGTAGTSKSASTATLRETSRLAALPERAPIGEQRGELFGSKSWTPPVVAAPAAAPVAVQAPEAPPNPYKVAGTFVQAGATRVYLVKGDRIYEARKGDDLDEGYRVDAIAVDHVVLLYVPLGKKEQLPITTTLGADIALAPAAPAPSAQPGSAALAPASTAVSASTPASTSASASAAASDSAKPAELSWQGPDKVRAGASFTVALRVSSDQPLRATPMQLRYEPELLEAIGVRAGKFFGQGNFSYRVNADGSIFVGATGQGTAPGADAELVVVTFRPIKSGATAEVKLSSVALQGAAGRALAHNQVSVFRTAIQ
jgi:Cohesin domain